MTESTSPRRFGRDTSTRQFSLLVAATVVGCVAVFVAAAFTDLSPAAPPVVPGSDDDPPALDVPGRTGGEVVVAAAGWPACLNPVLTRCADPWLDRTVAQHVFPKLMELDAQGEYVASPLLVEAPTVANGGISEDPFRISFRLDPDARWSDGTPVTSGDVFFTWQAHLQTTGAVPATGYDAIESIDTTDPSVAVVSFIGPEASWPELFGGERGYVLPAAAFLSSDVARDLQSSIAISGGPWSLEAWDDDAAALVPNPAYWEPDRIPRLDRVTFVRSDLTTEDPAELLDDAAATWLPRADALERPEGRSSMAAAVARSPSYEAVWLAQTGALGDLAVRDAVVLAVNRHVLLAEVVRPQFPEIPLLQCVAWVPTLGRWCPESDFGAFPNDPERARARLADAGYVRGPDGIFTSPDGERLTLRWLGVEGDEPREIVRAIATVQAWEVGIEIRPVDVASAAELEARVRDGDYDVVQLRTTARADPSVTDRFSCDVVPGGTGADDRANHVRWCDPDADELMQAIDVAVDGARRRELVRRLNAEMVEDRIALPLWQRPAATLWRPDAVSGPLDEFTGSPYGATWNLWAWQLPVAAASTPSG